MLLTEWDWDKYVEVREREAGERGREEGEERKALVIARNALAEGASLEFIRKITGMDLDAIRQLSVE